MRCYAQIITTPTADTPGTTLFLHFDDKRYLIGNIPEGTQRAIVQRGVRLNKLTDIFVTGRTEWSNLGGLIGLILSQADAKRAAAESAKEIARLKAARRVQQAAPPGAVDEPTVDETKDSGLDIYGARNLTHLLASARRFVFRTGMPIRPHEIPEEYPALLDASPGPEASKRRGTSPPSASKEKDTTRPDLEGKVGNHAAPSQKGDGPNGEWEPTWRDSNINVWAMPILPSNLNAPPSSEQVAASPKRKRSFDEYEHGQPGPPVTPLEDNRDLNQQMRRSIVSEMFDSDWRLDALVEESLSRVPPSTKVYVRNAVTGHIEKFNRPPPTHVSNGSVAVDASPDVKVLMRKPWPGTLAAQLPAARPSKESLSYIFKNHPQRGRFRPDRAVQLGVEPGVNFSMLTHGKTIRTANGNVVTPDMVLGKGKEGGGMAVIDLPSVDYVENLVNRKEWRSEEVMRGVGAMVWILGSGVSADERWQSFVRERSHIKHIVSSPDHCPNSLALDSAAAATVRLHQLDPARFSVPSYDLATLPQAGVNPSSTPTSDSVSSYRKLGTIPAQRGQMIQLEPSVELQDAHIEPPLDTGKVLRDTPQDVLRLAQEARDRLSQPETAAHLQQQTRRHPGKDAEIISLGTGSASPSKYRNVSATLLRVPGCGSYLLDCGEGTLGQLRRVFRPEELAEVLGDLRAIWISHMHADHHLGTASVIRAWHQLVWGGRGRTRARSQGAANAPPPFDPYKILTTEKRLFVVSGSPMTDWLRDYATMEDYGYERIVPLVITEPTSFPPGSSTSPRYNKHRPAIMQWDHAPFPSSADPTMRSTYLAAMGLVDLQAVDVSHCHGAKAISMTFAGGFKFSYSGDCRPSRKFARIGQGSTVLVHEATFDDELAGDAVAKRHSTTSEAINVGLAMGAKRVLLTHFSQRYQQIPVMEGLSESQQSSSAGASQDAPDELLAVLDDEEAEPDPEDMAVDLPDRRDVSAPEISEAPSHAALTSGGVVKVNMSPAAAAVASEMKVGVAFDYMRVKVGEINQLEYFTPALKKLFEKGDLEDDDRSSNPEVRDVESKRQIKKEKKRKFKKPEYGRDGLVNVYDAE